jgi:hypothetical protein
MPHIVIAVDGTNSYAYRRRWVQQFYEHAVADYKAYWPGPTDLGGATGLDCTAIENGVILWLTRVLNECGLNIRTASAGQVNLTLVGHSRGGHTIIDICNSLNFPATFMALYDAVDMTAALGDTSVIRNSLYTAHARRSPHMDSWSWWGNTGTSVSRGTYEERFFETNHGGVGGDVGDETISVTSDSSCIYVAPPPNPPVVRERCYRGECFDVPVTPRRRVAHEVYPDIHSRCGVQSDEANNWIRSRAVDSGIRFS